ncbi:uncharacterized protein LOC134461795 [Engraulis encrasicolus]|uniref:uncharacterized protein LOC134461795 n=1 Tax=Engraulis encrasicolus TaxID=184585 RepID=UPI002FCF5F9C
MGWRPVRTLLTLQVLLMPALLLTSDVITAFQGTTVMLPSCESNKEFTDVQWNFQQRSKNKLLAMRRYGQNWRKFGQDRSFSVTDNGTLVFQAEDHLDAAEFICQIVFSDGTIQQRLFQLHIQHHNISSVTPSGNLTADMTAEDKSDSFLVIVIACPVVAVVLIIGVLAVVTYRCRNTGDDAVYANIGQGQQHQLKPLPRQSHA